MSKLIAFESVTLDGVMQAPGRPDEDRRNGFDRGGWAAPYADADAARFAQEAMRNTGAMVFGRRTYEDFYGFWPKQKDNPYTDVLNQTRKYVASTTLHEPLPWMNSALLNGDAAGAIGRLKVQGDKDLVILGSGQLVRSLMPSNVIDEYMLLVHPLVLGSGQHLFEDGGVPAELQLVDSRTTSTGVVIAVYRPAVMSSTAR